MKPPRIASDSLLTALVLVTVTVLLRLWRLGHGLPEFLEEALPYRTAFAMAGWETGVFDPNPHFFNYPSLTIYLQLALQWLVQTLGPWANGADFWLAHQLDPTLPVTVGRLPGVVGDAATVLAAWRLGERLRPGAGALAGALVAFSPVMIETSRLIFVEPVMTALMLWSLERMIAWQERGGRGRLLAAILLMGLAAGAKYNAGLLALPLAWVLWRRDRWRGLRLWPATCAGALLVFLATSPWVLPDFATFRSHFGFETAHMAAGHLGTVGKHGLGFLLRTLVGSPGLLAAAAALAGLVGLVRGGRPSLDAAATTVWVLTIPLLLSVALFRMEAARYVAPLVPLLAVTGAAAALRLTARLPGRRRWAAVFILVPLIGTGLATAAGGLDNTRQLARRWCQEHLAGDDLILQEEYGAPLFTRAQRQRVVASPRWTEAAPELRRRFEARPVYRSVRLPLTVSGSVRLNLRGTGGGVKTVVFFPHAAELNDVFYHPALFAGAEWVVTSGAVRRRYENDPGRHGEALALYAILDREAEVAARFVPRDGIDGPEVTVYRLDARAREALDRPLDPLWWLAPIPLQARREVEALTVPPAARTDGALRDRTGDPAAWTGALAPVFRQHVHPFLVHSLQGLYAGERWSLVREQCAAILAIMPHDEVACLALARAARAQGDGRAAAAALEAGIRARRGRGLDTRRLEQELAR